MERKKACEARRKRDTRDGGLCDHLRQQGLFYLGNANDRKARGRKSEKRKGIKSRCDHAHDAGHARLGCSRRRSTLEKKEQNKRYTHTQTHAE